MADPKQLSPTKINTYRGCSMAYFLKYIEREWVPTNIRLAFGLESHQMLYEFYKKNFQSPDSFASFFKFRWMSVVAGDFLKGKDKERLEVTEYPYFAKNKETGEREERIMRVGNHIDLSWADDVPGVVFGYMGLGARILREFYQRHDKKRKDRSDPVDIEKGFGVRKDEPILIGDHPVRGVFDRIDEMEDGRWFVTDYKTDKKSPEGNAFLLHRHPQFTMYSYAFRKVFDAIEKALLYYHLRSGQVFETHRSEKDYDYLKRVLDDVAEGITKDRFIPFYGYHCGFCDYQVPCEKYSLPYHGGPRIDLEGRIKGAKKFTEWDSIILPDWMDGDSGEE